jgi:hypothetical protein
MSNAELGPTNVVLDAKDIIPVEEMTPCMKLVITEEGESKFVVEEGCTIGYDR